MAGEPLATTTCDGCGNDGAMIKKISNSPLLYLHCKQCGCDRRSGAALQAKWQAVIDGEQSNKVITDAPAVNAENAGDWQPDETLAEIADIEQVKKGNSAKAAIGFSFLGLSIVGILFKAIR